MIFLYYVYYYFGFTPSVHYIFNLIASGNDAKTTYSFILCRYRLRKKKCQLYILQLFLLLNFEDFQSQKK